MDRETASYDAGKSGDPTRVSAKNCASVGTSAEGSQHYAEGTGVLAAGSCAVGAGVVAPGVTGGGALAEGFEGSAV